MKSKFPKARKLTVDEVADKNVDEEALAGSATVDVSSRSLLGVQRVEERGGDEVGGPDHRRRCDEEAFANTTDREAKHLG